MLKALTHRDKFNPDTNFNAWFYTIMRNLFINGYRRTVQKRNAFANSDNEYHLLFSKDNVYPAPDSFYITQEIQSCINSLDDEYRIPFTMFLEGYRYKEIAKKLDLPLGTVKSRMFFTRKKLEKTLNDFSIS